LLQKNGIKSINVEEDEKYVEQRTQEIKKLKEFCLNFETKYEAEISYLLEYNL